MWIFLVEDEKQLARSLKRGLEEEGHVVEVMHDGEKAELQGLSIIMISSFWIGGCLTVMASKL